jgi:hypothetical protein
MKGSPEVQMVIQSRSKVFTALQAAIPFLITLTIGTIASAVIGLFVYANSTDMMARDGRFLAIIIPGIIVSIVFGYVVARRALEADPDANAGPALSLLKKYRRISAPTGADHEAGQYHIGEQYLRELLGRRGA